MEAIDPDQTYPRREDGALHRAWRVRPPTPEQFIGVIRGGPPTPAPGADYSEALYWVDRVRTPSQFVGDPSQSHTVETIPGVAQTVTAVNLAEAALASHLLAPGTLVQVFAFPAERGSSLTWSYVFWQSPWTGLTVRIDSPARDGGVYNGVILTGHLAAGGITHLAYPAGLHALAPALILNAQESGLSGHRLAPGTYN